MGNKQAVQPMGAGAPHFILALAEQRRHTHQQLMGSFTCLLGIELTWTVNLGGIETHHFQSVRGMSNGVIVFAALSYTPVLSVGISVGVTPIHCV